MDDSQNLQTLKGTSDFPFVEHDLPAQLGCSLVELQKIRKTAPLQDGLHFVRHKNRVCLSAAGYRLVLEALGLETAFPVRPPEPVPLFELTVVSTRTMNPHVIVAVNGLLHPTQQTHLRVRVKSKDNFRFGMKLKATHVQADLYELSGNCPRRPGHY
jgi:hypothetical protein